MRRRLERLDESFLLAQDAFRSVGQRLSKLQDDFHLTGGKLALEKAAKAKVSSIAQAREKAAWFEWTAEIHRAVKDSAQSQESSLGETTLLVGNHFRVNVGQWLVPLIC